MTKKRQRIGRTVEGIRLEPHKYIPGWYTATIGKADVTFVAPSRYAWLWGHATRWQARRRWGFGGGRHGRPGWSLRKQVATAPTLKACVAAAVEAITPPPTLTDKVEP